jgi:hypothetical protein
MKLIHKALFGALVAACGANPTANSGGVAPEAAAPGQGTPSSIASSDETGPSASTVAAPAATAAAPIRFHNVTQAPAGARLHALEGALLVSEYMEGVADLESEGGNRIGVLQGESFVYPETLFLRGWDQRIVAIQGSYPDGLHLLAVGTTGRIGIAEHYVSDAKTGWRQKHSDVGSFYVGVARVGDSLVGLTTPLMVGSPAFVTLRGRANSPKFASVKVCPQEVEHRFRETTTRVLPVGFTGTSSGDLVAFGNDCLGEAAFEVWKSGVRTSTIFGVPGHGAPTTPLDEERIAAGVANDVWVLTEEGRLLRYADGSVTDVPVPPQCSSVNVSTSGAVWLLCSGRALEMVAGEWQPQATPEDRPLDDLATTKDGTVWGVGGGLLMRAAPETVLAAGGAAPAPIHGAPVAPAPSAVDSVALSTVPVSPARIASTSVAAPPRPRIRPGSPSCPNNLVVLYAFTKTTPADYDFPLTRKALLGHTEFSAVRFAVTRDGGRRYFSARVPSYAIGKQLQAVISEKLEGSKPQVLCAQPEVEREVTITL